MDSLATQAELTQAFYAVTPKAHTRTHTHRVLSSCLSNNALHSSILLNECLIQLFFVSRMSYGICDSMHLLHGHLSVMATGTEDSNFKKYHGWENKFFSSDRVNVSSVNGSNAQTACAVTILEQVHGE